jgi:hypothetical protein
MSADWQTGSMGGSFGRTTARSDAASIRVDRTTVRDERSIGELFRSLQKESTTLLRQEVELARAELTETVRTYARNALGIAVGAALLLGALFGLLFAVNLALAALLEGAVGPAAAAWLSPLLLAAVLALVGTSMVRGGVSRIRAQSIVPPRTTATLRGEKLWLKKRNA